MQDNQLIRQRLMRRRNGLLARYHDELERAAEELATPESEQVEQATEQWDAWVLSRLGESDARALQEIVAALHRLDEGTYGICVECGESIIGLRLEALPATAECIRCAADAALADAKGAGQGTAASVEARGQRVSRR